MLGGKDVYKTGLAKLHFWGRFMRCTILPMGSQGDEPRQWIWR